MNPHVHHKEQIRLTIDAISLSSVNVKAVTCDGNILFDIEPQQPWLTKGGVYLLYEIEKHKE